MAFATKSRRATRSQPTWTVVPFDARGAGVGEIPHAVAIETPGDGETLLVLCAEAERPEPDAPARCLLALDGFRAGFAAAGPRMLTNALLAGMEEANAALYDRRAARAVHRPVGVGLTAFVARGADGYIVQAGPGQALIVGEDGITALPPLGRYPMFGGPSPDERAAPPPLGMLPTVEPDLFHIAAGDGLFAVLSLSALGRVLHHEDDAPLRAFDPALAAEYLVALGTRFRLPQAYGVVIAMNGEEPAPAYPISLRAAPPPGREPTLIAAPPGSLADAWPDAETPRHRRAMPAAPAVPEEVEEPRWEYLGEPVQPRVGWRDRLGRRRAPVWDDPYRATRRRQLPNLPPRLLLLLGGLLVTLLLAGILGIANAVGSHRANTATLRSLDGIAAARGQAIALRDPQAAYAALVPLNGQLDKIAADGRQTKRVTLERQQLTQALDRASGVARVTPRPVATLPHAEGTPGSHRLLLAGEDGALYLYEREKSDWGVYAVNAATQKTEKLFATGTVANKVPASDLRGLFWVGGPATTDRTRLFARTANGGWGEVALPAVGEKRPTALAVLGNGLYLLDRDAGLIARVPLADGGAVKPWTTDAAAAELRSGVDMASDGQTIWVLLADGRVRGFVGGTPAQLIAPAAIPPVKEATAVATSALSPYLYVAEGAQGRILRIRKADGRIVQVLRATDGAPAIAAIQSLAVDEARGTLSYVTADAIMTIPLPPVDGA